MKRLHKITATLVGALVMAGLALGTLGSGPVAASASSSRHHQQVVHSTRVWHAERVHAAHVRYAAYERWVRGQVEAHGAYWLDGYTVNTAAWRCIENAEEGGQQAPANQFGFSPFSGYMTFTAQRALAIADFRANGWKWGPYTWTTYAVCGLP